MSKLAVFLANGMEEVECLAVVDVARRAGVDVRMVSVTGDLSVTGSHGITRPQRILGVEADGIVGERTLAALAARDPEPLFHQLKAARIAFVEGIVRENPSQRVFLQGWKNRINALEWEG